MMGILKPQLLHIWTPSQIPISICQCLLSRRYRLPYPPTPHFLRLQRSVTLVGFELPWPIVVDDPEPTYTKSVVKKLSSRQGAIL